MKRYLSEEQIGLLDFICKWFVLLVGIPWILFVLFCPVAFAADPDCGTNGGIFGHEFRAQFDRPEVPVVAHYYENLDDLTAACTSIAVNYYDAIRDEQKKVLGCADMYLRLDGVNGHILLVKDGPADVKKHERCHIRYGAWH